MLEELFNDLINQLANLKYSGRLALFSNNESFLDNRIVEFIKYARKSLPHAYLYLYKWDTIKCSKV